MTRIIDILSDIDYIVSYEPVIGILSREERLDHPDIPAALEKMGGEAVAQCVQRHAFLDPGRLSRFMKQATQLARSHRPAGGLSAGE